jgi:hypothetical protein
MEVLFFEGSGFFHADIQKWKIPLERRKEKQLRRTTDSAKNSPAGFSVIQT